MNLGTINGLPVLSISIMGEEQGYIKNAKDYKEAYELIKALKEDDKRNNIKDVYTLCLETENDYYYGYTIRKYRKRYIVK